jgi:alpha-mannosidase
MKKILVVLLFNYCAAVALFGADGALQSTNQTVDLSKDKVLYEIGYSHLDTNWRWTYPQVIREFLPNTVHDNLKLFEKYPDYVFNWTGAGRYELIKEYHPEDFAAIRDAVTKGRWFPAGSSWEENDVNSPASESIIRQLLMGHEFFMKEFGTESDEYMLPDCFGFPASLPSILAHCGMRGFSTQKLTWGSAVGIPFNVGTWEGPDGNSIIAALNPGGYGSQIKSDLSSSKSWLERLDANGAKSGVFADFAYFGTGDRGGAPSDRSVYWIERSVTNNGPVRVISARANQMFDDITDAQKAGLPKYKGDLLLTQHSAGSLTSEAYMKRWNRENEMLADAAERASVAAYLFDGTPYPREKLNSAWGLVLRSEMHDMLPGTCLPKAYEYIWNDEIIAMNSFAEILKNAVGAVASAMDTRTTGTPLIVYNPLSIEREDVVSAEMEFSTTPAGVQVFNGEGKRVPTQLLSTDGNTAHFLFLAKVPSVGFSVFSAKALSAPASSKATALRATDRSLENARYKVTLNDAGDVASIFDKTARRELLAAPARLSFTTENPHDWPAWNMDWQDQKQAPRGYLDGPAKIRIVENGPVRVAIVVEREAENSIFTQTIRLAAGEAGDRVEVNNHVDWQTGAAALKAEFPLTVTNSLATYNWDLGKIQRGNNDPKKYEVPSHQWFDLTDQSGKYGVSVLSPTKYGSDKPADDLVRLTLLYSPGIKNADGYHEQQWQDWGRQEFVYGIYGHEGDWRDGKSDWQAARLSQPLLAFQTATHDGRLGKSFSLLQIDSDQAAVRAIKLAEDSEQVVVRLQELNGTKKNAVNLHFGAGIQNATEITGIEKPLQPLRVSGGGLKINFTPYQLHSLALTVAPSEKSSSPLSVPLDLPYNLNAFTARAAGNAGDFDGTGSAIPSETISNFVVSEGIHFKIAPHSDGSPNAVSCEGQTIALPAGQFNKLYILAASVNGDTNGTFLVDGKPTTLHVQNWTGSIGRWDNRVFSGQIDELTYSVNNPLIGISAGFIKRDPLAWYCSHRRLADGSDVIYSYSYLFKYGLDLAPGATTLTLPNNPAIRILAITASQNENDQIRPAQPLYDDFTGRQPIVLRNGGNTAAN